MPFNKSTPTWAPYLLGTALAIGALWTQAACAAAPDAQPPFVKHLDHGPRADIGPALYQQRIAEWKARTAAPVGK
ncbi:MAG: hypothetical protein JO224_12545 [Pelomonas sp.]|nr:hypothetical protein [Roseateles sp.]